MCVSFSFAYLANYENFTCAKMEKIANDPKKIEYIRAWAIENSKKPEVLTLFHKRGAISYTMDRAIFEGLNFNWNLIGMDINAASINFIMDTEKDFDASKHEDVIAVSFNYSRSPNLIVVLNEKKLKLTELQRRHQKFTRFNDVYINCGD